MLIKVTFPDVTCKKDSRLKLCNIKQFILTQTVEMATHANWAKHLQASVMQKDARMVNKLKEDWNGLQLRFWKLVHLTGFQS